MHQGREQQHQTYSAHILLHIGKRKESSKTLQQAKIKHQGVPSWILRWSPQDADNSKEYKRENTPESRDNPSPLPKFT